MEPANYNDETANFQLQRDLMPVEVIARFTVPGEPSSKSRPRFARVGGKTRAYTPAKTVNAEKEMAWHFKAAARGWQPDADSAYGVAAVFFADTRQRRDVDNMLKLICDALNGVAWKDDEQVYELSGRRGFDQIGNARTEVMVYRLGDRQTNTKACQHCGTQFPVYPSTSKNRKYCTRECGYAARRETRKRTCTNCGKHFEAAKPGQRAPYCSVACKNEHKNLERECVQCGATFITPRSLARTHKPLCGDKCRADYWREHRKTAAKGTCQNCGGPTSKKTYKRCASCAVVARRKKR